MSGRLPIIAFLAGLPRFEAIMHVDPVIELRSGCVVSSSDPKSASTETRFQLILAWPGSPQARSRHVDAYKYVALQVQEAGRLGFDVKLTAQSAESAMLDASEWRPDGEDNQAL